MRYVRLSVCAAMAVAGIACGWNPSRPFDRDVPAVNEAIADLDAGDAASASSRLEEYLSTGRCSEGSIGTPDTLKRRPDGTFDLGLALFRIAERYGRRFGEEDVKEGADENAHGQRHAQIECARRLLEVLEGDAVDPALRARARYLEGNLEFLDGEYEDAVKAYDRALVLAPGRVDAGDSVGRDAAWNRAIALRRIEDKKDAGQDAAAGDGSSDAGAPDSGRGDGSSDTGRDASNHGSDDAGDHDKDSGPPPSEPDAAPPPEPDAQPPPPSRSQDERMLDQLENAPTVQQEEAKHHKRQARGMVDK